MYDESDEGNLNFTGDLPGVVVIPNVMGHKRLYIGTLLAGLCSNILEEFAMLVRLNCQRPEYLSHLFRYRYRHWKAL